MSVIRSRHSERGGGDGGGVNNIYAPVLMKKIDFGILAHLLAISKGSLSVRRGNQWEDIVGLKVKSICTCSLDIAFDICPEQNVQEGNDKIKKNSYLLTWYYIFYTYIALYFSLIMKYSFAPPPTWDAITCFSGCCSPQSCFRALSSIRYRSSWPRNKKHVFQASVIVRGATIFWAGLRVWVLPGKLENTKRDSHGFRFRSAPPYSRPWPKGFYCLEQ